MRFHTEAISRMLIASIGLAIPSLSLGQQTNGQVSVSPVERILQESADQNRFTFIVCYKANDSATKAMASAIQKGIAPKGDRALLTYVRVNDPAEKRFVDHLGVARASMPMCVAMAPNGAVTGAFGKIPTAEQLAKSFVTPTMTRCMKAMQEGKIVLVFVRSKGEEPMPSGGSSFLADPQFKDRTVAVTLDVDDPAEVDFLNQLKIDGKNSANVATVMLAPPGVLVGKYTAAVSSNQMAADLHAAGKCCDDPNCKHHQRTNGASNPSATQRR